MNINVWVYFGFTVILGLVFLGIIIYYFTPRRKDRVEKPKYRMLDEDED